VLACPARSFLEPIELFTTKRAEPLVATIVEGALGWTGFCRNDIVQPYIMGPIVVEALPPVALRTLAEAFEIEFALIGKGIVLARNVKDLVSFHAF
jgi:hypothetical protein